MKTRNTAIVLLSIALLVSLGFNFKDLLPAPSVEAALASADPFDGKSFIVLDYAKDSSDHLAVRVANRCNLTPPRMTFSAGRFTWENGGNFREGPYTFTSDTLRCDSLTYTARPVPGGVMLDAVDNWFYRKLQEVK